MLTNKSEARQIQQTDKAGGKTELSDLKSAKLSPSKAALSSSLDNMQATIDAGGDQERTSITLKDGTSVAGQLGPKAEIVGNTVTAESQPPNIPAGYSLNDVESVNHSHITKIYTIKGVEFSGGNALKPSTDDKNGVFRLVNTNLISGPLGEGTRIDGNYYPPENGVAVYRGSRLEYSMPVDAVRRMISIMK